MVAKPPSSSRGTVSVSVYLLPEVLKQVDAIAEAQRIPRTAVLNGFIARGMDAPELPTWALERFTALAEKKHQSLSAYLSNCLLRLLDDGK